MKNIQFDIFRHREIKNVFLRNLNKRIPVVKKILDRLPEKIYEKVYTEIYRVTERFVEIPFVFYCLGKIGNDLKLLDVGCNTSLLPLKIASLGYDVVGVDINEYEFKELIPSNFRFIKGDITKIALEEESFDCITCISVLEHVGLGAYGDSEEVKDIDVVNKIFSLLKKGGYFVLTVPYGKKDKTSWFRVYDKESLEVLIKDFEMVEKRLFLTYDEMKWLPVDELEISKYSVNSRGKNMGVACLLLRKNL